MQLASSVNETVETPEDADTFMQRIATVCDHFGNDLEARSLKLQREILHDLMDGELAR